MFKIFKKKSPTQKLQEKREKLLNEAFKLSKVNRTKSDEKMLEADNISKEIERLDSN